MSTMMLGKKLTLNCNTIPTNAARALCACCPRKNFFFRPLGLDHLEISLVGAYRREAVTQTHCR